MNRSNVKLILMREIRDQLRDRRTLFMIAVLPLLLYPLLGMSFFQIAQFMRERPTKVLIIGLPQLDGLPPLVDKDRFATQLLLPREKSQERRQAERPPNDDEQEHARSQARLMKLDFRDAPEPAAAKENSSPAELTRARQELQQGGYEAVVEFPRDFAQRLEQFRAGLKRSGSTPADAAEAPPRFRLRRSFTTRPKTRRKSLTRA